MLVIRRKSKKTLKIGDMIGLYLVWYGIVRIFIESLRTDSLMLGSIKMAQLIGLPMIIIGIILIMVSGNKDKYNKEVIS